MKLKKLFALVLVLLVIAGVVAGFTTNNWHLVAILYAFPAGITLGESLKLLIEG